MSKPKIWLTDCNKLRGGDEKHREEDVRVVLLSEFSIEQVARIEAERQLGELRDSLTELNGIERKRDAAVALLRECVEWFDDSVGRSLEEFRLLQRGRALLNTTSTEGKDHE